MTTPYLQRKALVQAKELLQALADSDASPGVPDYVPDLILPVPPFSRLRGGPEAEAVLAFAARGAPGPNFRSKP